MHFLWPQCFETLEINYKEKKKTAKNTNSWNLNNMLVNNQSITEEMKSYLEANNNEDTTTQNLWGTANAVLIRKFIAIQSYLKKEEKTQPNLVPKTEKEEQSPKLAEGKKS